MYVLACPYLGILVKWYQKEPYKGYSC